MAFWNKLHITRVNVRLLPFRKEAEKTAKQVRIKEKPLNVLFFAIYESMWKYDSLCQRMLKDPNFNPLILVCALKAEDEDYMIDTMQKCGSRFENAGYQVIYAYNKDTKSYLDPHQLKPDIIFYTRPYSHEVNSLYSIEHNKDILSCYVDYFYITMKNSWAGMVDFQSVVWRYYLECPLFAKQIRELQFPLRFNGRVTGYPLFDSFREYVISKEDWPVGGKRKKRIIWAPHHTINSNNNPMVAMSTFEKYYDFMLIMADKYKDVVDVVFKPHPLLKPHLYEAEDWGKERTDAYYEKWATGENTAFVDGEYVGLFLASDAMIHDCNSFTVEYLAVNKPAMFLDSGKTDDKLNAVGKEARECYYKGYSEEDIERFIQDVVSGGKDELSERREAFYKNYILPPNGKLAAENIIEDLLTSLGRK